MRVYDFSNQQVFSSNAWLFVVLLLLFGLLALTISFLNPKVSQFIDDKKRRFLDENRSIVHMLWVSSFSIALLITGVQIKNYIYVKHVDTFYEVKMGKGNISNVNCKTILGVDYVTIRIGKSNYTVVKDERYLGYRNLLVGDSVKVRFFKNKTGVEVISIDIVNPS